MSTVTVDAATGEVVTKAADLVGPVDCYRDAAPLLRRPFTPQAVKFKVQSQFKMESDDPKGLVVAYIDARLVVERLNLVCPHLWFDEYQRVGDTGGLLICKLTIDGITRTDVGEGVGKGLWSDALKRAAVKFGVGVSLYAVPQFWVSVRQGHAKTVPGKNGPQLKITPAGEAGLREQYREWLFAHGFKGFGGVLDHGDTENAIGDSEVAAHD